MGQSLVKKYRNMVESENVDARRFAGLPTSQSQVNYLSVRQHPNPMFGTLDPSNTAEDKVLLDFYQKKYNCLDLSKVNQVHAQKNNRLAYTK